MTRECEDAISRDELLKAIDTWDKFGCDANTKLVPYQDHYIPYIHYDDVIKCIKGMPPVAPQPKMGRWLHREIMDYLDKNKVRHNHFMCEDCGFIHDFIDGHTTQYKYCPSCGAKMQEVEE